MALGNAKTNTFFKNKVFKFLSISVFTRMGDRQQQSAHRLAKSVVEQYSRQLHRYLMNCLRHSQTARDLEQEVYLRLLRVPDAELVHNALGYVHRIAVHVVHEYRMRIQKDPVTFDSLVADHWAERSANTAADEDPNERRMSTTQQLERMVRQLPPGCREAFILNKCHGLSRTEVAQRLNLSENTVKIYVNRAVAALRAAQWE